MRVVVSGYVGFGNGGDEAMLAGLLAALRAEEPGIEVSVLSGDPRSTEAAHGVRAIGRTSIRAIGQELRRSDGLISGGGSLLQDVTSARPVAYYAGIMGMARLAGRPYVVHAQGLGPLRRAANRALAAAALRGAAHVSLRDRASIALARDIGVRRETDLAPDPALALRTTAVERGDAIVVAVRSWRGRLDHLEPIRRALDDLASAHPIRALPMQLPTDREAASTVIAGVARAEVVEAPSIDALLSVIGSAHAVIGMRLHALVLAAAAGVPAVAISYDPKVDAFAEQAGQPIVGRLDRAIDPEELAAAVTRQAATDPTPYLARVERLRAGVVPSVRVSLDALRRA